MAWKMVATIFPQTKMTPKDRNLLLTLATLVSLHDLLDAAVRWKAPPPRAVVVFEGRSTVLRKAEKSAFVLKESFSESEIDRAALLAEEIFDRYGLDEEERATLFTALPCLGLHALGDRLEWIKKPPFPELG